ncbi:hypothetical protein DAETH_39000 (plasmid) [Deinococcus aetherius]|uniref:SnoaL-like domain-containing protein n=1 Tax=Deinococcus aetherius TaxID=200252 RepID=A0ABM8AJE7_9DEIO|nr:ester cyclase [Deinococcus aetherius]BDP43931.1 hypothetical protein DAETH_39000 [Deinococcus aetherius]
MTTILPRRAAQTTLLGLLLATGMSAAQVPTGPTASTVPTASGRPVPPIVQKWITAWNTGDANAMAALFTDDGVYQDYAFGAKSQGKSNVGFWVTLTVQNIPDARGEILDAFQIGDRVAVQWIFSGTPLRLGPVQGTGKSFAVPVTSVFSLKGGRIQEVADYYNRAEVFGQLGLPTDGFSFPKP